VLTSEQSTVLDLTGETPRVVRYGAGDTSFLG
jgi:tRNA A37 threonylcarbamoyladenosine synthetase subunit TsaC/SUA5/YrdC